MDPHDGLDDRRAREGACRSRSSATRWHVHWSRRSTSSTRDYDVSSLVRRRFGRRDPLAGGEGEASPSCCRTSIVVDSIGASETGYQGTVRRQRRPGPSASSSWASTRRCSTTTAARRRPATASSGGSPAAATSRSATTRTRRRRRRTFTDRSTAERWVLPGDMAMVEADGTITLLGRGSVSINSGGEKIFPEEVEIALEGPSRRVRRRGGRRARRALGRAGRRGRDGATGERRPTVDGPRRARPPARRRLQGARARCTSSTRSCARRRARPTIAGPRPSPRARSTPDR